MATPTAGRRTESGAAVGVVPVLRSWTELNDWLMSVDDEAIVRRALAKERRGRNRSHFVRRIYSRLARLRSRRERVEAGYSS